MKPIEEPAAATPEIAIIDYYAGNMFSVQQACRHAGMSPVLTSDKKAIAAADAVILPGVGAFGEAMNNLRRLDLVSPIADFIQSGRPFIGICLGLQLLFTKSEEFGTHRGLGIIDGYVTKFSPKDCSERKINVPQMGWNQIFLCDNDGGDGRKFQLLHGIPEGAYMYFVHSFYAVPSSQDICVTTTDYEGIRYCSAVRQGNVFATQFHPEKSACEGVKIYHNLARLIISQRRGQA